MGAPAIAMFFTSTRHGSDADSSCANWSPTPRRRLHGHASSIRRARNADSSASATPQCCRSGTKLTLSLEPVSSAR